MALLEWSVASICKTLGADRVRGACATVGGSPFYVYAADSEANPWAAGAASPRVVIFLALPSDTSGRDMGLDELAAHRLARQLDERRGLTHSKRRLQ